jgi:hypothetical protein
MRPTLPHRRRLTQEALPAVFALLDSTRRRLDQRNPLELLRRLLSQTGWEERRRPRPSWLPRRQLQLKLKDTDMDTDTDLMDQLTDMSMDLMELMDHTDHLTDMAHQHMDHPLMDLQPTHHIHMEHLPTDHQLMDLQPTDLQPMDLQPTDLQDTELPIIPHRLNLKHCLYQSMRNAEFKLKPLCI